MPDALTRIVVDDVIVHSTLQVFTARDGRALTRRGRTIHKGVLKDWTTIGII